MLRELQIQNYALIDTLELALAPGMSVLTGETGAGKSILLGALGLTLGDRADSDVLRRDDSRAEVSAVFDLSALPQVNQWLAEQELDADGECILRRTIGTDGRSRAFINGSAVPVALLRELGEQLVDIHGQHAHQSLLKRDIQRQLLDTYGGHDKLLKQVQDTFRQWRSLQDELEHLSQASADRDARLELLRYQVEELEQLAPDNDELSALDEEHQRLANMQRLQEGSSRAAASLYEDDEHALLANLERTLRELQELQGVDVGLKATTDLLEGAAIQAREAVGELRHYLDQLELDPARLEEVEQRLVALHDAARKHHCTVEELPDLLTQLQEELAELEQMESRHDGLQEAIDAALVAYRQAATALSEKRARAAAQLAKSVTDYMHELGMGEGRFEIQLSPREDETPAAHGLELVEFIVTANPGQPLRPLAKVASGGELSRISLAIQVANAGKGGIPTLIFDEVDVGVGGGVAEMVGRRLRALGGEHQVLCVTHQPQVAAQGHQHLQISKQSKGGETRTEVVLMTDEARVNELARMLGGVAITEQTLSHAREMIALADKDSPIPGKKGRKRA